MLEQVVVKKEIKKRETRRGERKKTSCRDRNIYVHCALGRLKFSVPADIVESWENSKVDVQTDGGWVSFNFSKNNEAETFSSLKKSRVRSLIFVNLLPDAKLFWNLMSEYSQVPTYVVPVTSYDWYGDSLQLKIPMVPREDPSHVTGPRRRGPGRPKKVKE